MGYQIAKIKDNSGNTLKATVVGTLMRIDLKEPLKPGKTTKFSMGFAFNIAEEDAVGARAGYEHFEKDGNDIFLLAQWFPSLAAYTDYEAWTNKAFLGSGEFTLEFGNYDVELIVPADQPLVMAMSFFPVDGGDLWKKYSIESIVNTMEVYSRFSFDYPYPVALSVNGPVGCMEYPMITFNGPRTELQDDGKRTYTQAEKRFLIGVVIHEVGHIYFPMIVNSDERQWTSMNEGLNSFLDGIAGREWESTIPWGVEAQDIVPYMKSERQVPIMTQSDSILNFGRNAYAKPAVALNVLREVILGRELFDFAFKEYAQRWKYKRPTPSDFFRTMEEASGVDLDWFWRGWFYSTVQFMLIFQLIAYTSYV